MNKEILTWFLSGCNVNANFLNAFLISLTLADLGTPNIS